MSTTVNRLTIGFRILFPIAEPLHFCPRGPEPLALYFFFVVTFFHFLVLENYLINEIRFFFIEGLLFFSVSFSFSFIFLY